METKTFSEWVEFYRNRGEDYGTSYAWAREEVENQEFLAAQKHSA